MLGLGYPQRATGTFSLGSWEVLLPLSNTLASQITKVARSVSASTSHTKFVLDCGAAISIRAIELRYHNMTTAATWRIRGGTTSGASDVYSGSFTSVFRSAPEGITGHDWPALEVFTSAKSARYWSIEIDDTTNPDGYVEIGALFMCPVWTPTFNASYGLQDSIVDLSQTDRADGGDQFFVTRGKYRQVSFVLEALSHDEAATMHDLQRLLGTTGDVLYIPSVSDLTYSQRYGFRGVMTELSPIDYPYYSYRKTGFRIVERL